MKEENEEEEERREGRRRKRGENVERNKRERERERNRERQRKRERKKERERGRKSRRSATKRRRKTRDGEDKEEEVKEEDHREEDGRLGGGWRRTRLPVLPLSSGRGTRMTTSRRWWRRKSEPVNPRREGAGWRRRRRRRWQPTVVRVRRAAPCASTCGSLRRGRVTHQLPPPDHRQTSRLQVEPNGNDTSTRARKNKRILEKPSGVKKSRSRIFVEEARQQGWPSSDQHEIRVSWSRVFEPWKSLRATRNRSKANMCG